MPHNLINEGLSAVNLTVCNTQNLLSIQPLVSKDRERMPRYTFKSGGFVAERHHRTKYIYPSALDMKVNRLRLLPPVNHETRRRPQGEAEMDTDFITISPIRRQLPSATEYAAKAVKSGTQQESLDIAMYRATRYTGNTVLEAGIVFIGQPGMLWIVVRRKTLIRLDNKTSKEDSDVYKIPLADWNKLKPSPIPEFDHWWRRLDDLFKGRTDRACLCVKQRLESLGLRPPWVRWATRPDVDMFKPSSSSALPKDQKGCVLCGDDYDNNDRPVILSCDKAKGHHLCIACLETALDRQETRLKGYLRCPYCRKEHAVVKRLSFTLPGEKTYWRYRKLEEELADFIESFELISNGLHLLPNKSVRVNAQSAITFMDKCLIYIEMVLPYGYQLDNPVTFLESNALHKALRAELRSWHGKIASVTEMQAALEAAAKKSVKCVRAPDGALGNPEMPPNFVRYRDRLVRRVAHSCFLSPDRIQGVSVWIREDQTENQWPANVMSLWMR
jgi:hypothetical protein